MGFLYIFVGLIHINHWGELAHLRAVGWTTKYTFEDHPTNRFCGENDPGDRYIAIEHDHL